MADNIILNNQVQKKHIKHIGRFYEEKELLPTVGKDGKEIPSKVRKYMASKKNMLLFYEHSDAIYGIYFIQHEYMTSDKEEIEFLDNHPAMDSEIFKDRFPEWLIKKFAKDKDDLTYFKEESDNE